MINDKKFYETYLKIILENDSSLKNKKISRIQMDEYNEANMKFDRSTYNTIKKEFNNAKNGSIEEGLNIIINAIKTNIDKVAESSKDSDTISIKSDKEGKSGNNLTVNDDNSKKVAVSIK